MHNIFRTVLSDLKRWQSDSNHKPIILRGARQVGKTHLVRTLGLGFDNFVEVNFERMPDLKTLFDSNLDPKLISEKISLLTKKKIIPNKTLLFLDEIQECPNAIKALRYFYEELPDLHIIAAGSLLDFVLDKIGVPVGRVTFRYIYPVSFAEYLLSCGDDDLLRTIMQHDNRDPMLGPVFRLAMHKLAEYVTIGGMPEALSEWISSRNLNKCTAIKRDIIEAYRQDFDKYSRKIQHKYVELIFRNIPVLAGKSFKYSMIEGNYKKRELEPCIDLLERAGLIYKIFRTHANGIPLFSEANIDDFKLSFLDIGLLQTMLGVNAAEQLVYTERLFEYLVNKGQLAEIFVAQEILAYQASDKKGQLFFWHRNSRSATAEVDYVIESNDKIIPIEVKSGATGWLKSLHYFLAQKPNSPYAIRFSGMNYSEFEKIKTYPLFAVMKVCSNFDTFI